MTVFLAVNEDDVRGRPVSLAARPRAIFVRHGMLRVTSGERVQDLHERDCALFTGPCRLEGEGVAWTFEVSPASGPRSASGERERLILGTVIDRDPTAPILLRADRVEFPAGAVTPKHGHKGPGIRRLIEGRLHAELGHEQRRIDAGEAWFESGADPVVGRNLESFTAFVRVMALDPVLKGEPTFIPWTPADAAQARGSNRHLYFDELVSLGAQSPS